MDNISKNAQQDSLNLPQTNTIQSTLQQNGPLNQPLPLVTTGVVPLTKQNMLNSQLNGNLQPTVLLRRIPTSLTRVRKSNLAVGYALGASNFATAIRHQLKRETIGPRHAIWNGSVVWKQRGAKDEMEVQCEILSKLVNGVPEVKGDAWQSKLVMRFIPIGFVGGLGGTHFLDAEMVVFKFQPLETLNSLLVHMKYGCVGYAILQNNDNNGVKSMPTVLIFLYSNVHKGFVGFLPKEPVFISQFQQVLQGLLTHRPIPNSTSGTTMASTQETPPSTTGETGGSKSLQPTSASSNLTKTSSSASTLLQSSSANQETVTIPSTSQISDTQQRCPSSQQKTPYTQQQISATHPETASTEHQASATHNQTTSPQQQISVNQTQSTQHQTSATHRQTTSTQQQTSPTQKTASTQQTLTNQQQTPSTQQQTSPTQQSSSTQQQTLTLRPHSAFCNQKLTLESEKLKVVYAKLVEHNRIMIENFKKYLQDPALSETEVKEACQRIMRHLMLLQHEKRKIQCQINLICSRRDELGAFPPPTNPRRKVPDFEITGIPAAPPAWNSCIQSADVIIAPYLRVPINSKSKEYSVLESLLEPLQISKIDRILNPNLWRKFIAKRKELMSSKTENLELMCSLGLNDAEIQLRAHININYEKEDPISIPDYSDNVALLFHGTRSPLNTVLIHGLDERVGRDEALLGRGIYFADDPVKSMCYDKHGVILIYAVYLGDCLSMDGERYRQSRQTSVKEPEKGEREKRNHTDLTFDSITARPKGFNEYVIYNRSQCCPMYAVEYKICFNPAKANTTPTPTTLARHKGAPFAWSSKGVDQLPDPPPPNTSWPFFAQTIFKQMESNGDDGFLVVRESESAGEKSRKTQLALLAEFGFPDDNLNQTILEECDFDLEKAIELLLLGIQKLPAVDSLEVSPQPGCSKSMSNALTLNESSAQDPKSPRLDDSSGMGTTSNDKSSSKQPISNVASTSGTGMNASSNATIPKATKVTEECKICTDEYEKETSQWSVHPSNKLGLKLIKRSSPTADWKVLKCNHKICVSCHKKLEELGTRTTMSGETHTCVKCPFCKVPDGVEIGTCPNGKMTVTPVPNASVAGYENFGILLVRYKVVGTYNLNRVGLFPNNVEGKKVVSLLRVAWDRRLCFEIGTSNTTGMDNVLVWNIHHKTALNGGVDVHGYPDPTYLQRTLEELAGHGIQ